MRVAVALAVAMAIGTITLADEARAAVKKHTNIQAQDLGTALQTLAKDRNIQLVYASREVSSLKSSGAVGELTTDEALTKLLQGTGLTYFFLDDNTITVAPAGTARSPTSFLPTKSQDEGTGGGGNPAAPEEVIVTGQKLQEGSIGGWLPVPLHELPRSVQVIDEQMISNQFVSSIKDIIKNVPGVQIVPDNNLAGYSTPTIRGVPASQYFEGHNAGVVTGIPEVIGRAEVLQGFNSLQFGLDGGGGSVNFFMKRPTAQSFLQTELQTTNWGGGKLVLDGNLHVDTGETDGVRFVGVLDRSQTYVRDYPRRNGKAGSVMVRYSGFAGIQFDADFSVWDIENDPSGQYIDFVNAPNVANLPDFDPRKNLTQTWSENSMRKGSQWDVRASRAIGENWKVTAEGSLNRLTYRDDGCRVTAPDFATGETGYNCFRSGFGPLWDRYLRLDFTGKFSLLNMEHYMSVGYRRSGQAYVQSDQRTGFPQAPYDRQNIYNPRAYPEPTTGDVSPANFFRSTGANELYYFQDRIAFTPQWDLWAGVGYVEQKGHYGGPTFPVYYPPATTATLPTGALVFKPTEKQSYYISYSEGINYAELVNPNDPLLVNAGELLPALHYKNVELGGKWIINSRLQLSAAAFRMQQPFTVTEQVQDIPPRYRRFAGGLNEFTGVSVDFYGKLLRNLDIQGGFAVVDPVQEDTQDPALKGKKSAGVAHESATLNVIWDVGATSGLSVDGGLYYQGDMPLNVINTYDLEGFTRLDLGASYNTTWNDREVRYRVLVENALDDRFYYGFIYGFQVAAPRTVNASVSVRF